jgi:hypothetical protein
MDDACGNIERYAIPKFPVSPERSGQRDTRRTPESGQRLMALAGGPATTSLEASMHEIKVITISAEEVEHGVAELWAGGQQIAYTVFDDGELTLRFEPRHDGSPVVVGVRSLTDALAEVERVLA